VYERLTSVNQILSAPGENRNAYEIFASALSSRRFVAVQNKESGQSSGFDTTDWLRVIMYRRCFSFIENIRPETLDVLEISGGSQWRRKFKFGSYTSTDFPEFDICAEVLDRQFDLIIADQVFEHLTWPMRAGSKRARDAPAWWLFHHSNTIPGPCASSTDRLQSLDRAGSVLSAARIRF
jgi:hypothetical protein